MMNALFWTGMMALALTMTAVFTGIWLADALA